MTQPPDLLPDEILVKESVLPRSGYQPYKFLLVGTQGTKYIRADLVDDIARTAKIVGKAIGMHDTRTPTKSAEVDLDALKREVEYADWNAYPPDKHSQSFRHDPRGIHGTIDYLAASGHLATGKGGDVWHGFPDNKPDNTGLDDGPPMALSEIMAWKKPLVIKAFQEGLNARACGRVFGISHETAYNWTAGMTTEQQKTAEPDELRKAINAFCIGHLVDFGMVARLVNGKSGHIITVLEAARAHHTAISTQCMGDGDLIAWVDKEIKDYENTRNMVLDETGYEPPDFGRMKYMKAVRAALTSKPETAPGMMEGDLAALDAALKKGVSGNNCLSNEDAERMSIIFMAAMAHRDHLSKLAGVKA